MYFADMPLGDIASKIPGATRLFRQYRMDFCCGGARSLRQEAERKNADLEALVSGLEDLANASSGKQEWSDTTTEELVAHVLARYHVRHREQLVELIRLAGKVERVHAAHAEVPAGLSEHLTKMAQELECHMQREERILFPLLLQGQQEAVAGPISVMESEHVLHGDALEEMLALSHQLQLPENACHSWRALYLGLSELRDDLMEHIHLENNILFKRMGGEKAETSCNHGVCGCVNE